jgi:tRNA dimethylallyltransferase
MSAQRNILAVIGTTGVGKSAYAISLARSPVLSTSHIRPTVLSSDSMQLYEGLPVITNKVTEEEMAGVEHWGLGVVKPGVEGSWEVGKWCLEAWEKVSCGFLASVCDVRKNGRGSELS